MSTNNSRLLGRNRSRYACKASQYSVGMLNCMFPSDVVDNLRSAIRKGDWLTVVKTQISPFDYSDAFHFAHDYLAASLLSKYPDFKLGLDTRALATEKFFEAERICAITNNRLASPFDRPSIGLSLESYIHTARVKIRELLGDFCWDDAEPYFGFSGGASTRLPRRRGDAYYKFQGKPETTPNNAELARSALLRVPMWASHLTDRFGPNPTDWVKLVIGNRVDAVPKNAKIDRIIAIEPDLNMFVQKGLGSLLRLKLKRVGVDLDSQQHNQHLAYAGSLDGSLATLDLSMASDCVSLELCRALLPPDWFDAFMASRSPRGVTSSGDIIVYEKMSSMGNGFTFELESLIFWALSKSVMSYHAGLDRRFAIYGDDIIVPTNCSLVLTELLQHCGFSLNYEKSFMTGPFRESCGKHYFAGVDVTPFFIRKPIDELARELWFMNSIRRWTSRSGGLLFTRFQRFHAKLTGKLPPPFNRPGIPDGIGDGALIGSFDEVRPELELNRPLRWIDLKDLSLEEANKRAQNLQRFKIKVLAPRSRKTEIDGVPAVLRALMYAGSDREPGQYGLKGDSSDMRFLPLPDERPLYKVKTSYTSRWDNAPFWGESLIQPLLNPS